MIPDKLTNNTTYVELMNIAERGLVAILMDATHKDFFEACKFVLSTLGKDRGYTMQQHQPTCWDVPQKNNQEKLNNIVMGLNTDILRKSEPEP